ncbi:unnamed protein product [Commensalibacter communis]|uniref:phage neck terminator protein n=1 Tax=Commensalibacter communis TaxID=2972786 RepID=UPI0022FFB23E|nr:hypothetical protein [Commensalibacter communis]CAI3951626.1 unnamed protein product [Commensalibacter communis]CAI3955127.1 unnamed protein product [Commensalibacter communis]
MTEKKTPAKVTAKAPKDKKFPKLKTLTYKEMCNLVGKFLQKAIPIRGAKLQIIRGLENRVSTPKPPYIVLQVTGDEALSSSETRYTDQYKITWCRSQITMGLTFIGNDNIPALQMAKAFSIRFNDAWASEQFEQYQKPFFPLYSDDALVEPVFVDAEDQYQDKCSMNVYFEYHPEVGVCEASAKEIIMSVNK